MIQDEYESQANYLREENQNKRNSEKNDPEGNHRTNWNQNFGTEALCSRRIYLSIRTDYLAFLG